MSKNVLVISTSLRKGSNSDLLADEFVKGAVSAGNKAEKVSLVGKKIEFCKGCLACQKTQKCVICDDANEITEKMLKADVIAFATPIYYYEMSGQMKTILDRANSLYSSDYKFRDIYMLYTAADENPAEMERAVNGLGGWIECFEKARLAGKLFCGGVNEAGEIKGNSKLAEAFDMGKSV